MRGGRRGCTSLATTGHILICRKGKGSGKKDIRGSDTCFKHAPLEVLHVNVPDAFDKRTEHKSRHKHNDIPNVFTPAGVHFSSTLLVCMQNRHQDCGQHSCTLCVQDCDQNFFRAPRGILAGKSPGYRYRYWLRFWGRSCDQNFQAFFLASHSTHFKDPVPTLPDHIARPLGISKNCPR